ncbi:aldo/keto reductase, partial [Alphaproteobacteria bacterium]|nr:aldo/keto reductase [Alphaproteobacteria bacterium]
MGIGGEFKKNTSSDKEFIWALEYGVDLGMTFLDTAEVYAEGHSETLVGKVAKNKRDKIFIATKFSPQNNSYDNILISAEKSLKRLNTTYIDLYQIHWPNPNIPISETLMALEKLVKDGKVRFIGLSNFSKREMEEAQKNTNFVKIVSNQVEYNLFDRYIEKSLMPFMFEQNSSIIAYSPLDQGHGYNDNKKNNLMRKLSKKYNKTESQISLNWLLSNKNVFVIPKAVKKKHIELNASSADFKMELDDIKKIGKIFSDKPQFIMPSEINVSVSIKGKITGYKSIDEAVENKLKLKPSPVDLAQFILNGEDIKPVRVIHSKLNFKYELVEGHLRFWAWNIAYSREKAVPCLVRNAAKVKLE